MGNQQPGNGQGAPPGMPPGGVNSTGDHSQQSGGGRQSMPGGHPPHGGMGYGGAYGGGGGQDYSIPRGPGDQQHYQQQQPTHGAGLPGSFQSGSAMPYGVPQQQIPGMHPQQQQGNQQDIQRSASDVSMTDALGSLGGGMHAMSQGAMQGPPGSGGRVPSTSLENWLDDDTVPTVFRWEHGGRQVYITGTFNGWSRQIPMHRSGNDFTYIHNLKRGKHAFKFIVDDEWRFAPDQPTVADIEGRINNFIDVTDFKPYTGDKDFEKEKAAAEYGAAPIVTTPVAGTAGAGGAGAATAGNDEAANEGETDETQGGAGGGAGKPDKDGEVFSHTMPDLDDYTKEPPPLPPHLRHIILNKPPQLSDTAALPVPQHVALNHLYCTAIKDNMMVLGITQRYKTKFVTTVYYSPCTSK